MALHGRDPGPAATARTVASGRAALKPAGRGVPGGAACGPALPGQGGQGRRAAASWAQPAYPSQEAIIPRAS